VFTLFFLVHKGAVWIIERMCYVCQYRGIVPRSRQVRLQLGDFKGNHCSDFVQALINHLRTELIDARSRVRDAYAIKEAMLRRPHTLLELTGVNRLIQEYETQASEYEVRLELLSRIRY